MTNVRNRFEDVRAFYLRDDPIELSGEILHIFDKLINFQKPTLTSKLKSFTLYDSPGATN